MDIFRSKEAYIKVMKDEQGINPLIPARGVYVVGQYLQPDYHTDGVKVLGISSTHPKIVDFTEKSVDVPPNDSITGLVTFTSNEKATITRYSTQNQDIRPNDSITGLVTFTADGLKVSKYTQVNVNTDNSITGLFTFTESENIIKQNYYHRNREEQPDSSVLISNLRIVHPTITDVAN